MDSRLFSSTGKFILRRRFVNRNSTLCAVIFVLSIYIIYLYGYREYKLGVPVVTLDMNLVRREIELSLEESVSLEKGTGCIIPHTDLFSEEVLKLLPDLPKLTCEGTDWVDCYMSECYVVHEIRDKMSKIECTYRDILFETDMKYGLGRGKTVHDDERYRLNLSDHVKVSCNGKLHSSGTITWEGHKTGFRPVEKKSPPDDSYNILILGFDSTSHNGFLRHMPKVHKFLTEELHAIVLNSHNVLGDGTAASLVPLLSGKTEWELPDARRDITNNTMDNKFFIFDALNKAGYRTAYFEDSPIDGTFQRRYNGFRARPADHYLRHLLLEHPRRKYELGGICIGAIPEYAMMLNITEQFFELKGSHFCFTFVVRLTHDGFNLKTGEDDTLKLLTNLHDKGKLKNTMLIVMGDHGIRYSREFRSTYQGKLEERLPFMSIVLPERLKRKQPDAVTALKANSDVLTTSFDIYETLVEVLRLKGRSNDYKVPGSDLPRGMSLLKPIPSSRSCGEAGVEAHWCACVNWYNLSQTDPMYKRAAQELADRVNDLTAAIRTKCIKRQLISIEWVMKQDLNEKVLRFNRSKDADNFIGRFDMKPQRAKVENYQAKIVMGPGKAVFEGLIKYYTKGYYFFVSDRDISRTTAELRNAASPENLKMTYSGLCQALVTYFISAWGGTAKTHVKQLEIAQRSVLKTMLKKPRRYPTEYLYREAEVLSVRKLFILRTSLAEYKTVLQRADYEQLIEKRLFNVPLYAVRITFATRFQPFVSAYVYNKVVKACDIKKCSTSVAKIIIQRCLVSLSYEETEALTTTIV